MSRLAAMLRGRKSIYVRFVAAVVLALSSMVIAPSHAVAATYANEAERLLAIAARHQGQIYGHGGNGYNSRGQQDLRVPIDCRAFVAVVWSEGGYDISMPSNVPALQSMAEGELAQRYGFTTIVGLGSDEAGLRYTMDTWARPGDWIIFGQLGSSAGTHAAIYAGKDSAGQGLVWSAESSNKIAPLDGTRPGVQRSRWEDFHGHNSNGTPWGIFPIEIVQTYAYESGTLGRGLPAAPIGYNTAYPGRRDFTGDGYDDMLGINIASDGSRSLSVYPSLRFNYGTPITMDKGPSPAEWQSVFSPGDWDANGYSDVFALVGSSLLLYKGSSSGLGVPEVVTSPGIDWSSMDGVFSPGSARWPGSTKPDILARDRSGRLLWFQNGNFNEPKDISIGRDWSSSKMPMVFSPGDWNSDSYPDVIGLEWVHRLDGIWSLDMFLYKGNQTGLDPNPTTGRIQIGSGFNNFNLIFSPGDFSGDGRADVIARFYNPANPQDTRNGYLYLYKGNGGTGFSGAPVIGNGWGNMTSIFGGRFCGNNPVDVMAVQTTGSLLCYPGSGSGGWAGGPATIKVGGLTLGLGNPTAVFSPGDFDGDKYPDVVTLQGDEMRLYRAMGTHLVDSWKIGTGVPWSSMKWVFSPGDFDRDGPPDVIAVFDGPDGTDIGGATFNKGDILLFRGDGAIEHPGVGANLHAPIKMGNGWGGFARVFSPGDFDGDNIPDVIAMDGSGNLLLYRGNGSSTSPGFSGGTVNVGSGSQFDYVFSPGDIDKNGIGDVVGRSTDSALHLYLGDAKPGYSSVYLALNGTYPSSSVILNS